MVHVQGAHGSDALVEVFGGVSGVDKFGREWFESQLEADAAVAYDPSTVLLVLQFASTSAGFWLLSGDAGLLSTQLQSESVRVSVTCQAQQRVLEWYLARVRASTNATLATWVVAGLEAGKAVAVYAAGSRLGSASTSEARGFGFPLQIANKWFLAAAGSPARVGPLTSYLPGNTRAQDSSGLADGDSVVDAEGIALVGETAGVLAVRTRATGEQSNTGHRHCRMVAACHCIPHAGLFRVIECQEDASGEAFLLTDWIERALVRSGARELVLQDGDLAEYELHQLDAALERIGGIARAMLRPVRRGGLGAEHDLRWLVAESETPDPCQRDDDAWRPEALTLDEMFSMKLATDCAHMCVRFLDLGQRVGERGRYRIEQLAWRQNLQLDAAALKALHVLWGDETGPASPSSPPPGSLWCLLDRCRTPMGSRLLRTALIEPLGNREAIERRLDLVELLVHDVIARQRLADYHLKGFADLITIARRLARDKTSLRQLVRLYQSLVRLPALRSELEDLLLAHTETRPRCCQVLRSDIADRLAAVAPAAQEFIEDVERFIDLERITNHEYLLRPSMSTEMTQIRGEMDTCLEEMNRTYQQTIAALQQDDGVRGSGGDWLKLERKDGLGFCFRVTRKDEVCIRGKESITVLETRKDGVRFTTSALRRWSSAYTAAEQRYVAVQRSTLAQVFGHFAKYASMLEVLGHVLALLDMLVAFAMISAERQFCRPRLVESDEFEAHESSGVILRGLRHPLVELALQGEHTFVANDVVLTHPRRLLLITGPNMGGKSVTLRSVGLAVLMAHCGCFVAADAASLPVVDRILVRVGAGDVQTRGISTFMAEMLDMSTILRHATSSSLVLVDELGRGTSTAEGFGLAAALCEALASRASWTLFATHFHELTKLAQGAWSHRMLNAHVAVAQVHRDNDDSEINDRGRGTPAASLVFLYELRPGPSERSFGIHIAEMAGFPHPVIDMARAKVSALENTDA
jgi:DNA mismatch repair protein MSH2